MKEQIYTIPLNDAFKKNCECPLCELYHNLEKDAIEFMLGASYMEGDIREETNKIGFCKNHIEMMYKKNNSLGLALMLNTHLNYINTNLNTLVKKLDTNNKKTLFSKKSEKNIVSDYIDNLSTQCYICNKIDYTFDNYIDTFFYMFKKDNNFVELLKNSNGFCINHFSIILNTAQNKLNSNKYKELLEILIPLQIENSTRVNEDIDWYVKKFDYKYEKESWKNSKDALPRTIQKISSIVLNDK